MCDTCAGPMSNGTGWQSGIAHIRHRPMKCPWSAFRCNCNSQQGLSFSTMKCIEFQIYWLPSSALCKRSCWTYHGRIGTPSTVCVCKEKLLLFCLGSKNWTQDEKTFGLPLIRVSLDGDMVLTNFLSLLFYWNEWLLQWLGNGNRQVIGHCVVDMQICCVNFEIGLMLCDWPNILTAIPTIFS